MLNLFSDGDLVELYTMHVSVYLCLVHTLVVELCNVRLSVPDECSCIWNPPGIPPIRPKHAHNLFSRIHCFLLLIKAQNLSCVQNADTKNTFSLRGSSPLPNRPAVTDLVTSATVTDTNGLWRTALA